MRRSIVKFTRINLGLEKIGATMYCYVCDLSLKQPLLIVRYILNIYLLIGVYQKLVYCTRSTELFHSGNFRAFFMTNIHTMGSQWRSWKEMRGVRPYPRRPDIPTLQVPPAHPLFQAKNDFFVCLKFRGS